MNLCTNNESIRNPYKWQYSSGIKIYISIVSHNKLVKIWEKCTSQQHHCLQANISRKLGRIRQFRKRPKQSICNDQICDQKKKVRIPKNDQISRQCHIQQSTNLLQTFKNLKWWIYYLWTQTLNLKYPISMKKSRQHWQYIQFNFITLKY